MGELAGPLNVGVDGAGEAVPVGVLAGECDVELLPGGLGTRVGDGQRTRAAVATVNEAEVPVMVGAAVVVAVSVVVWAS